MKEAKKTGRGIAGIVVSFLLIAGVSALFSITCCLSDSEGTRLSEENHDSEEYLNTVAFDTGPRAPIADRSGAILAMDSFSPDGKTVLRSYPYGSLAAHVLGFNTPWGKGLEGVEFVYESIIRSRAGRGSVFHLTLSREIQEQVEKDLKWQVDRLNAESGCTIMMDITNGQILAMAATPSWNPAVAWRRTGSGVTNPALQDNVDPWIILPLMLEADKFELPVSSDEENKGETPLKNRKFKWKWSEPAENLALWSTWDEDCLSEGYLVRDLAMRLSMLGFGQLTGIDLPGEKQGVIPAVFPEKLDETFDPGFRATPIQMLQAFALILNKARPFKPHVAFPFSGLDRRPDKESIDHGVMLPMGIMAEKVNKGIVRPDYKEKKGVLSKHILPGSGSGPAMAGIKIFDKKEGAAFRGQVTGMGFWPLDKPQICYVTVLNNVRRDPRIRRGTLGHTVRIAQNAFSVMRHSNNLVADSTKGVLRPGYDFSGPEYETGKLPDVRGFSMRSAAEILFRMGIRVSASGSGTVVSQAPSAGADMDSVSLCRLTCRNTTL